MKRIVLFVLIILGFASYSNIYCQLNIPIRVYIEGALLNNGGQQSSLGRPLMNDKLRLNPFNGLTSIPATDPYFYPMQNFDISQNYFHVEVSPNQLLHEIQNPTLIFSVTGDNAIVDWVHVQIRSALDSIQIISTRSGLVQRDGDVVDIDGVSDLHFANLSANNYYVVVKHRSHLGAMSKIVNAGIMVDFTNPQTPTYDFGQISSIINYTGLSQNGFVISDYNALWAGDLNNDGKVKFDNPKDDNSKLLYDVLNHPLNTSFLAHFDKAIGYYNSDLNMDGKAKFENPFDDKNYLFSKVLFYPINPYFMSNLDLIIEQVPKIQN